MFNTFNNTQLDYPDSVFNYQSSRDQGLICIDNSINLYRKLMQITKETCYNKEPPIKDYYLTKTLQNQKKYLSSIQNIDKLQMDIMNSQYVSSDSIFYNPHSPKAFDNQQQIDINSRKSSLFRNRPSNNNDQSLQISLKTQHELQSKKLKLSTVNSNDSQQIKGIYLTPNQRVTQDSKKKINNSFFGSTVSKEQTNSRPQYPTQSKYNTIDTDVKSNLNPYNNNLRRSLYKNFNIFYETKDQLKETIYVETLNCKQNEVTTQGNKVVYHRFQTNSPRRQILNASVDYKNNNSQIHQSYIEPNQNFQFFQLIQKLSTNQQKQILKKVCELDRKNMMHQDSSTQHPLFKF